MSFIMYIVLVMHTEKCDYNSCLESGLDSIVKAVRFDALYSMDKFCSPFIVNVICLLVSTVGMLLSRRQLSAYIFTLLPYLNYSSQIIYISFKLIINNIMLNKVSFKI